MRSYRATLGFAVPVTTVHAMVNQAVDVAAFFVVCYKNKLTSIGISITSRGTTIVLFHTWLLLQEVTINFQPFVLREMFFKS